MKKLICLFFVILFIFTMLAGCNSISFRDDLKEEVLEDYLIWSGIQSDMSVKDIKYAFLGQYKDSVAIFFQTAGAYEAPTEYSVAGTNFKYQDSRVIKIWNNGTFYDIADAYDKGLINYVNLLLIKFRSLFLKCEKPLFIYQNKHYVDISIEDEFAGNCVLVMLDKGISGVNKIHSKEFFAGVEIDFIYDLSYTDEPVSEDEKENWQQTLALYLSQNSKEKVLEAVDILEKIDGIYFVGVNFYVELEKAPDDTYYSTLPSVNSQWSINRIEVEKVWDFTVGSNEIKVGIIDTGIAEHDDLSNNYMKANALGKPRKV